ncbi:MAG: TRAP transporter large permease [Gammaproteobacteria bacterium]|nr:TRAP transporter large permease [Gammaproteobacteria bacterium]
MLALLFIIFFALLLLSVPVAFALGISALAIFVLEGLSPTIAFQRIANGISIYSLIAVPFFIFGGELMLRGGIAERLVSLCQAIFGKLKGGLGVVNVMSSMVFGGISGSAVADTSAIGTMMIPAMKKEGYDTDYAVNVTVTSSLAGVLIPPSHNFILFALAAGGMVSVSDLFLAGVFPGILMCCILAVVTYAIAVRRNYPSAEFPGMRVVVALAMSAIPGVLTGVIIVGGVLSGVVTVTESAAIGVLYALVVTATLYRSLNYAVIKDCLLTTVRTTGIVVYMVGTAAAFSYLLTFYRAPDAVINGLLAISDNKFVILLLINIALIIFGTFMDMAGLILICTPIFLPVAISLGIDPAHFGVIMVMNLGLGLTTPPVGACLFVGCAIGQIPIEKTVRTILPFYAAIFVALMLVTFIPAISMWLPNQFR